MFTVKTSTVIRLISVYLDLHIFDYLVHFYIRLFLKYRNRIIYFINFYVIYVHPVFEKYNMIPYFLQQLLFTFHYQFVILQYL
jgi:hypothetical protein